MEHMGRNEKQHKLVNKKSHQRVSPAFPDMQCTKGKYWDNCLLPVLSKAFIARIFRTQRRLGTVPTDKMGGGAGVQKVLPKHHHLQNGNLKGW